MIGALLFHFCKNRRNLEESDPSNDDVSTGERRSMVGFPNASFQSC